MNKRLDIGIKAALTVAFALAAYIFYAVAYRSHVTYHEQYQMFLYTGAYAADVLGRPGGVAEYLARFIVQFFYVASWGASILAVLLAGLQLLTAWAMRARTLGAYAISFAPAIAMWMALCDESIMVTSLTSLMLVMAALAAYRYVRNYLWQVGLLVVLTPALYMLVGPFSLVFTLAAVILGIINDRKSPWWHYAVWAALLGQGAMCPVWASWLFPYPYTRLLYGLSYFRYPFVVPVAAWCAAAIGAVTVIISPWLASAKHWAVSAGAVAVVTIGAVAGVSNAVNMDKEEVFAYDNMVRQRQWNLIIERANERHPDKPLSVAALNLALAKSGGLSDHMFRFYQNGVQGLVPKYETDLTMPLISAEIFYNLGMVNEAQHFTYEAMEAIPDFQKSARCYKRLAETNIINGNYALARKYLKTLQQTLLYDQWATEMLALLDNEQAIDQHPEFGSLRQLRYRSDNFFSEDEMDQLLGLLFVDNQQNKMAFEYLVATALLNRDLNKFATYYALGKDLGYDHIPASYQEALALKWTMEHDSWQGLPYSLSPQVQQRMQQYIIDRQQGQPLAQKYAGTYWVYYFGDK